MSKSYRHIPESISDAIWSATCAAASSTFVDIVPLRSDEFMFFLTHYQNRTRRRAHDPFGGDADAKMLPAGATVRSNDHEIDVLLFRSLDNFMLGQPCSHGQFCGYAASSG